MKNSDMSAYPMPNYHEYNDNGVKEPVSGISKREHFAGLAMQGLYMVTPDATISIEESASIAVSMADALLYELENN